MEHGHPPPKVVPAGEVGGEHGTAVLREQGVPETIGLVAPRCVGCVVHVHLVEDGLLGEIGPADDRRRLEGSPREGEPDEDDACQDGDARVNKTEGDHDDCVDDEGWQDKSILLQGHAQVLGIESGKPAFWR